MKKSNLLLGAGVVGLVLLAVRGQASARSLKNLQIGFSNFSLRFMGLTPVLFFRINAYNPDVANVTITNVIGDVLFKNSVISTFNTANDMNVVVPPKKTVAIDSRATLGLGALVQALLQKVPGAKIEIKGVLNTNHIEIPFVRTWEAATNKVQ